MDYENLYLKHFEYKTEKIMENENISCVRADAIRPEKRCDECGEINHFYMAHHSSMKTFCYKCIQKFAECVEEKPRFLQEFDKLLKDLNLRKD